MKINNFFVLFLLALFTAGSFGQTPEKALVNVDKKGVGLQGYDPVGFFIEHKPVMGKPNLQSKYNGVIYQFASAENKTTFDASPMKYEPQFGGYCAYGVSRHNAAPVEIDAFQIVNGRLLMQYDKDIRDSFNQDTQGNLKLADNYWPEVMEKFGTTKK